MIHREEKSKIISDFKNHDTDTGSIEVQIALLTKQISELTLHLKLHHKDVNSKRGLEKMVSRRKKCLHYLEEMDKNKYKEIIKRLDLRK